MTTEIRKIQKSKTGFYLNLPKKIVEKLNLTGTESVIIALTPENKLTINILKVEQ